MTNLAMIIAMISHWCDDGQVQNGKIASPEYLIGGLTIASVTYLAVDTIKENFFKRKQ